MARARYANPITVVRTSDKVLSFRFNDDAYFAIAINRRVPYAEAIQAAIVDDLDQRGLLDKVVFETFEGRSNSLNVEIGRKVSVDIAQAVIRACLNNGALSAAYSINQDDGRFGYTQRLYVGSLGEATGIRLAPATLNALLKEEITQREFLRVICPTIFGATLDPVYVIFMDTAQGTPPAVYAEVLVRLMQEGKVEVPEDPTNIQMLFRTLPTGARVFAGARVFGNRGILKNDLDLLSAKALEDVLEEYPQYREFVHETGAGYGLEGITMTSVYARTHTGHNAVVIQVKRQDGHV